jgi:hypothetical protein
MKDLSAGEIITLILATLLLVAMIAIGIEQWVRDHSIQHQRLMDHLSALRSRVGPIASALRSATKTLITNLVNLGKHLLRLRKKRKKLN